MKNHILLVICIVLSVLSCKAQNQNPENLIQEENVVNHIKVLASDEFLGRKPGTQGEEKTTKYIEEQLKLFNVEPANGSSYFQNFNIKKVQHEGCSNLTIESNKEKKEYLFQKDFYAKTSYMLDKEVAITKTEMIFMGFGIVAADYNWDDYKDVDVKDKIVVVLFSDPGYHSKNPELFNGEQPTYYAGIRHKKREAAKRGAAGLIMIHDDAINWEAVKNAEDAPIFVEGEPDLASDGLKFSGLISKSLMKDLLSSANSNYDYVAEALQKDFQPLNLQAKASITLNATSKKFVSTKNVVGLVKGSARPDEYVLYTAHWDHVGTRAPHIGKDSIFNGAIDNASGTAMQLEVARAFSKMKKKPERSMVFLFTSAEEMGLLGAEYYANNPLFPLNKTACVINADASFAVAKMRMVINVIESKTEMDAFVDKAAKKLGREIIKTEGVEFPGNVFQRSDHYPFVKKGLPAVWNVGNSDPLNGDKKEEEKLASYMQHYHQVTDEYYEGFDGANITFDAQLNFLTGLEIGNSSEWPNWNEGSEFKVIRDKSMLLIDN